ncbi:MAG: hypothetical protein AB7O62_02870 [Pirellulales bacterium]
MSLANRPLINCGLLAGPPLLAAALLAADPFLSRPTSPASSQFQDVVAGLGLFPATSLAQGSKAFDPRLDDANAADRGPLPAGGWFSTNETMSVLPATDNKSIHFRPEAPDAELD